MSGRFTVEHPAFGALDTGGTYLALPIDATDDTILVATDPGSSPWTTDPGDLPFWVLVGGESMCVMSVNTADSPQMFTVDRDPDEAGPWPVGTRVRLSVRSVLS